MFSSIFSNDIATFGLDIGYDSLKVVQLKKTGKGYSIKGFNSVSLPENSFDKSGIKNSDKLRDALNTAMADAEPARISTKYAITSLNESMVFSKIINVPKVKSSDLENTIKFEIAELFPIPIEELYYDWQIIKDKSLAQGKEKKPENNEQAKKDEKPQEELEILVVGAPKKIIDQYQELLQQCGIELYALETKSISSARAILDPQEKKGVLLVHVGAEASSISIFDEGIIRFTGTVNCGGNSVNRALSGTASLPEDSKEKEKIIQTLDLNLNENFSKKKEIIVKSLVALTNEINQAIKYYQTRMDALDKINRIIITGGGANIPHIADILEEHTGHHCGIANPFTNVIQPKDQSLSAFSPYTTAIGCALRSFTEK